MFDRRVKLCHIAMALRKGFCQADKGVQLALRKLTGDTRRATGLLSISISTITRRSPSAI